MNENKAFKKKFEGGYDAYTWIRDAEFGRKAPQTIEGFIGRIDEEHLPNAPCRENGILSRRYGYAVEIYGLGGRELRGLKEEEEE